MTLTPLTNTQIPDKAILDVLGRQSYLGNTFILPINGISFTSATEIPVALIRNPSDSGKGLFLFSRRISSSDVCFVRFYLSPTVTSNGNPTTTPNLRPASANTSISTCFLTPTIAANGTFISALATEVLIEVGSDLLIILDPGFSLLITGECPAAAADNPILVFSENTWYEI